MCAGGLSHALADKCREDGNIQDVSSVDEGLGSRGRKLCKTQGSLLRGDKSTGDVDCRVLMERGQWEGEGVLTWGKRRGADCGSSAGVQRQSPQAPGLTVVHDYAWDTKHILGPFERLDNIVRVGEVGLDVQLTVRAVCLSQ